MSDHQPKRHDVPGSTLLHHDIPEAVLDSVIGTQRVTELSDRYTEEWLALNEYPNLRRFIAVSSFEAAPDDIELRSKVTRVLLGMLALLDEAKTTENLEDLFANPA